MVILGKGKSPAAWTPRAAIEGFGPIKARNVAQVPARWSEIAAGL
jgi:hypothetical protein